MKQERMTGPLTTEEIQQQHLFWTKRAQEIQDDKVRDDQQRLGLKGNEQGILECQDRIQGHHPVYLPHTHPYTVKLVEDAHRCTLHGGVGLTMSHIRERYWGPRLRRLTKRVIKRCHGCRRLQVRAALRRSGVDSPTISFSSGEPVHLSLWTKVQKSIVRRLKQVQEDERVHPLLSTENIQWQFNLSHAPWLSGQFERLIGLVKRSLSKTIGNGRLSWTELEDVLLNVEVTLNNRPLDYVEEMVAFKYHRQ